MNIEMLQEICMSLPGATQDVKYDSDLCFCIEKKIFCGTRLEGPFRTGLKCTEEDFAELTQREGIIPMPRLSTTFWIRIEKPSALTKQEWQKYIGQSYEIVKAGNKKKKR